MGLIQVRGIRVHANHGCLSEEELVGGEYVVNVSADKDLENAERSDSLRDTVDYGRVAEIVETEMAVRSKLIEHVAKRILVSLAAEWDGVSWEVELIKVRPPINGNVAEVSYTVRG